MQGEKKLKLKKNILNGFGVPQSSLLPHLGPLALGLDFKNNFFYYYKINTLK